MCPPGFNRVNCKAGKKVPMYPSNQFSFFSNDDDGDDDVTDYEHLGGDGGVLHKWMYPQVRAPLLITLWSTSVHLLRKAGGNIFYDIHIVYDIIYYIMYYIICYIIR